MRHERPVSANVSAGIYAKDGSYLISGTVTVRDLNRRLHWNLPTRGPKTLNGLIVEYLEEIPEPGTSLMLNGYQVEIVRTRGTAVQLIRVLPQRGGCDSLSYFFSSMEQSDPSKHS